MSKAGTAGLVGLGCIGVLLIVALSFAVGAAFWCWVIMLVVGATKPQWHWGYWHTMFPWGVVAGLVMGVLGGNGSRASAA